MASITIWSRLEPRCRNEDFSAALQACTFDPLWMLARQWQLGEMQGDDAGTPISATASASAAPLDRLTAGSKAAVPLVTSVPLEIPIEGEGVRPAGAVIDYLQTAETGLTFVRMLRAASQGGYAAAYVSAYPIALPEAATLAALDAPAARLLRIAAGRVPDGVRLANDLRAANGALPASPAIAAADVAAVTAVCNAYRAWYDGFYDEPAAQAGASAPLESAAWDDTRMEYAFSIDASTSSSAGAFAASRYDGAPISWTSFDRTSTGLGAQGTAVAPLARTFVPAPVAFKGMPARRFWELEDADVDFGDLEAGPADLARVMLREFALIYGNDWFVLPLTLPARSFAHIESLAVSDTFGVVTNVPHYSQTADGGNWHMFGVTGDAAPHGLLLVPPAARGSVGDPIERVVLMRDDAAMMAWGVERIVPGGCGQPVDRSGELSPAASAAAAASSDAAASALRYQLGTSVPAPYIPYVAGTSGGKPRILRAAFRATGSSGTAEITPRGRVLGAGSAIFEEEFPSEGASIERRYRLVRGSDGSTHLWLSRRKRIGAMAPAAGLAFDIVIES